MDYSKWIVQLFGERCTKESRHHDRDSEPEWCDKCFAYAQHDEIERLREALKFYAEEENWHIPYLQGSRIVVDGGYKARSALQQKDK